jgi:uncharacterized protein
MGSDPSGVFAPARPEERLVHLDVIRGCALFGVLAMNVQYHFRGPYAKYVLDPHPWPDGLDVFVDDFLSLLVRSKAMALFGMLFAIGLAIQMERKEARGDGGFWGFAWRRMGALVAIGLLHVVLLWEGDILITYALAGILLFPFLRRKTRTIHIWIGVLAGVTLAMIAFSIVRRAMVSPAAPDAGRARAMAAMGEWIARATAVMGHGTWWEVLVFRLQEWSEHALSQFAAVYETFFSSLVGLAVCRSGVLRAPEAHLPGLRRWAAWLVGLGLAGCVVELYLKPLKAFCRGLGPWGAALLFPLSVSAEFGYLLLALGYGALILLAWQSISGKRLLGPFAYAGRMALTNYLTQSLAMTALFYGWGLGFYGRVTPWQGLVVSVLFFALQVVLCRWWLGRFLYGPAEWLWRCASYAHRQPFLIPKGR